MATIAGLIPVYRSSIREICEKHQSLYRAQKAGYDAIRGFPYLSPNSTKPSVNASLAWKASLFTFNLGYKLVATTARVIQAVAYKLYTPIDLIGGAIFPTNPINGKWHLPLIPRIFEKAIGFLAFSFATMGAIQENQCLPDGRGINTVVKEVFEKLKEKNSELLNPYSKKSWSFFNYEVTTIASSEVNACCFPGGSMLVFSEIIKQIDAFALRIQEKPTITIELQSGRQETVDLSGVTREDIIAALLGHEMTHAASRHSLFSIASLIGSLLISLIDQIRPTSNEDAPLRSRFLSGAIEKFRSRQCEYEADITGAYFAKQAGYNPLGALALEELLNNNNWIHTYFEFLSTHPSAENRKRAAYEALQVLGVDVRKTLRVDLRDEAKDAV